MNYNLIWDFIGPKALIGKFSAEVIATALCARESSAPIKPEPNYWSRDVIHTAAISVNEPYFLPTGQTGLLAPLVNAAKTAPMDALSRSFGVAPAQAIDDELLRLLRNAGFSVAPYDLRLAPPMTMENGMRKT